VCPYAVSVSCAEDGGVAGGPSVPIVADSAVAAHAA
jgi:hypothetical protein